MNPDVPISELCDLIRTCGESGVSDLTFGTLHVQFHAPGTKREEVHPWPVHDDLADLSEEKREQWSVADEKAAIEADELKLREEQLAMALLENPAEFEKLLVAGELDG